MEKYNRNHNNDSIEIRKLGFGFPAKAWHLVEKYKWLNHDSVLSVKLDSTKTYRIAFSSGCFVGSRIIPDNQIRRVLKIAESINIKIKNYCDYELDYYDSVQNNY